MTTAKIKEVIDVKGDGTKWNGTYYHNLLMENGDEIEIGKKKVQQVGWELIYEITGDGQQKYRKAKTPKREDMPTNVVRKKDDYVKGIEVGHAVNNAVNMVCAGISLNSLQLEERISPEDRIVAYAEWILKTSDELKAKR